MWPLCHKRRYDSLGRISKESHRLGFDHGSTVTALSMLISRASPEAPGSMSCSCLEEGHQFPFPEKGSPVLLLLRGASMKVSSMKGSC